MKTVNPEVNQYFGITWVPVLNQGRIKAGEGEGWALLFICCAQDTVGLSYPMPIIMDSMLQQQETFTFFSHENQQIRLL